MSAREKEVICFYHGNCTDGTAAAAVIHFKYPSASLHPMQHGDTIPVPVNGKKVFIVDFSFSAPILEKIRSEADAVFWYDHHKTAVPISEKVGWGVVDLSESGATLTWKQEFPGLPVPMLLDYVRDKDLWLWELPHSREINMALRDIDHLLNPQHLLWKKWIENFTDGEFEQLVAQGSKALRGLQMRIEQGAQFGFELDFEGYRAFAVNWSLESSELGEYIYKNLQYEVAIIFHYTGKHWSFSLRSDRVDVSELALRYGGGGHPGAAGFRRDEIEWLMRLKK